MTKELICITCPRGCELTVAHDADTISQVDGNACSKGVPYAEKEVFNPERIVTTTVHVAGAAIARVPVKTAASVPRDRSQDVVNAAAGARLYAPVQLGQVVVSDVAGTGVDLVATRNLARAG